MSPTELTFTHLRFQARACTPILLGQYQGAERLRDGLALTKKNSRKINIAAVERCKCFALVWMLDL
jgi:hypothetical protein